MNADDIDPGESLDRGAPGLHAAVCGHGHPLLEGVRCQRLKGHPGKHVAAIEHTSAEFTLEWAGEAESELQTG